MYPPPAVKMSRAKAGKSPNVLIVIVGAVALLAIFLCISSQYLGSSEKNKAHEPNQLKGMHTHKIKARPTVAHIEKKELEQVRPQQIGEIRDGRILLPSGRLHIIRNEITSGVSRVSLIEKTFVHEADRILAQVLVDEFGSTVVGDVTLTFDGFDKSLIKALGEPIVYDKNDSEYIKEIKMGVQALRQELKERMDAGEKINDIMVETYKQMQEIGLYRQELEEEVLKLSSDDLSQKDYDDLVSAANQLLHERGSKPLELPSSLCHAIRLRRMKENNFAPKER